MLEKHQACRKLTSDLRPLTFDLWPLDFTERLIEVVNDVFSVLDADRNAHQAVSNAEAIALDFRNRRMRHGRRMRNQRLDAAQRLAERAQSHAFKHAAGVFE